MDSASAGTQSSGTSIITIAFNEADKIATTLAGILAQDDGGGLEVIVVDDCSTDDTRDIVAALASKDSRLRLVQLSTNSGRGAARAVGVKEARGEFVGFVDADVLLPPHWLADCITALDDLDAVAGTAVPDGDVGYVGHTFDLRAKDVPNTVAITGSNCLFRREVFSKVAFDPVLRNGEDVKLVEDMSAAGLRTSRVPGLIVEHRETKSYLTSLRWLFESGIGATRQLSRSGEIRFPDLVAAGTATAFIGAGVAACALRRSNPRAALLASATGPAALLAVSAGHLHTKFALRESPATAAAAILAHAPLIGAYVAGRVVGAAAVARNPIETKAPRA